MDGYNPYRITKEGIDWEVEEPDDPWSYIGYWGDHQIIYLQKLLELSTISSGPARTTAAPSRYSAMPTYPIGSGRLRRCSKNPKSTVDFDEAAG